MDTLKYVLVVLSFPTLLILSIYGCTEIAYGKRDITLSEEPVIKQNLKKVLLYEWYSGYMEYRRTATKVPGNITADRLESLFQFSFNNVNSSQKSIYSDTKLSYEEFHKLVNSHTTSRELALLVNQNIKVGEVDDIKFSKKVGGYDVAYLKNHSIYVDGGNNLKGRIYSKNTRRNFYFGQKSTSCGCGNDVNIGDSKLISKSLLSI